MKTTLADYLKWAGEYNLIPVCQELLADTETPVSVLQRFAGQQNAFLLESIEGGETWGRYSFVGIDPEIFLEVDHAGPGSGKGSSLDRLRAIYRDIRPAPVPGLPRFLGGAVGFIGYEAVGEFERISAPKTERTAILPRSRFLKADKLIVFDNIRHIAIIIVCSRPGDASSPEQAYELAQREIRKIEAALRKPVRDDGTPSYPPVRFESNMTPAEYCDLVRKAKDHIAAGDAIQVVLSQRFSADTDISPIQLYRALRLLNPSPYMYFLKIGDQTLVGSSPEIMVRLTGSRVELRPIAGTRPRGRTEQEDRRLADELLSDEKEKAEHVMLVDLGRNDVGRVSDIGTVQVRDYMTIERYSHVMHIVSHVEGILRGGCDAIDVIRAAFPAGTLTGAPKIRAMEIIRELESEPRGSYGGAVGYVSYDGNMDMAITIRTMDVARGTIIIQTGAGIVYNSVPEREFEETCHKARGLQKAVELAANGLKLDAGSGENHDSAD